ncbi:LON peptidase substrate-binding domain-containing protein [Pseudoalteromonas atlantica]|uniref:LON peptidase substrate-binding domain-containing protein n=1 Tax=Pseudoalteromonas atlantica TaxID=288 RepID=UPI0037360AFE
MIRAIFPLPVFILPGGYTRLRIFETRYLDMVKEALKNDGQFVLCDYDSQTYSNVPETGCLVKIVDFDQDDNGNLLIDISAQSVVTISNVTFSKNKLRYGETKLLQGPGWLSHTQPLSFDDQILRDSLEKLFAENHELSSIYKSTCFDELPWVIARWLELIPISHNKKQQLAFNSGFANIQNFLHTVINNEFT